MDASTVLSVLWGHGFTVELGPGGKLLVSPSSTLHDSLRELLRAHKPEIVSILADVQRKAAAQADDLMRAAMRCCDAHGDGPEGRAEMLADIQATPLHLRADLLDHFRPRPPDPCFQQAEIPPPA
ncbi:hypothetical protein ACIPRI_14675 [Variovorax sp. LARHSF232]